MLDKPSRKDRAPDLGSPEDGVFRSMHGKAKLAARRRKTTLDIPDIPAGLGLSVIEVYEKRRSSYDRSDLITETLALPEERACKEFDMDILIANAAIQFAVHSRLNLKSRFGRFYSEIRHAQYWSSAISYLEKLGADQLYHNIGVRAVTASRATLIDEFLANGGESLTDPEKRFNAATWIGESILTAQISPLEQTTHDPNATD